MNDFNSAPIEEEEEYEEETSSDSRDTTSSEPTPVPTPEEMKALCANIGDRFKFNVDVKPVTFRFKTTKDDNGVEYKRDPLELAIPFPNVQGIIDILEKSDTPEGAKQLSLLMDAVESVIVGTARSMITDDPELNVHNFPVDKLSWEAIANMPKPERSGGGIAKEVWEDFEKDYIKVMPEVTGKTIEQVSLAARLLKNKFAPHTTNIELINKLVAYITMYAEASPRAEEFAACIEFLINKADKLVNADPAALLENL